MYAAGDRAMASGMGQMELREWFLCAAKQFGWSKAELIENIAENAHEKIVLAIGDDLCYSEKQKKSSCR